MKNKIKSIILCGGEGLRLRPITKSVPKPLVEINGKPILSYLLEKLEKTDITEHIIAAGYKSEKIYDYFANNKFKKRIEIVDSGNVDIIIRIQDCLKKIKKEDVIIFYGDTLSDIDISRMQEINIKYKRKASVALWRIRSSFGIMGLDKNNLVISYKEKPLLDKWINIGYFYLSNILLKKIYKFEKFEDFIDDLIVRKELYAYKHKGLHYTVNTEEELQQLTKEIYKLK